MKPRPTMPTLIICNQTPKRPCSLLQSEERFHIATRGADIRKPLVAGLALDSQIAFEIQLREHLEKRGPIDFARADDDLVTPSAGFFGPFGVLNVALLEPGAKLAEGIDGIAFLVQDEVGGIEVHPQIWKLQFRQKYFEGVGGFLTGFQPQIDAAIGERPAMRVIRSASLLNSGSAGSCGGENGRVEGDEVKAQCLRELGIGLDVAPVLFPSFIGHDAAGAPDGIRRGVILANRAKHAGDELQAALAAKRGQFVPELRRGAEKDRERSGRGGCRWIRVPEPVARRGRLHEQSKRPVFILQQKCGVILTIKTIRSLIGRMEIGFLQSLNEINEALGLGFQAVENVRLGQAAIGIEEAGNLGNEDAIGINKGVAVAKNMLELLHGTKRAPDAGREADETNRPALEALRELEHVDEIFQNARDAAVIFRA